MLLLPKVIRGVAEALAVTDEMRHRLETVTRLSAGARLTSGPPMRCGEEHGFALILVLWIAALLAVIAASLVSGGRAETRLARNLVENAKAEALADGGVQRAVLGLLAVDPDQGWRGRSAPHRLAFGDGEVLVSIADEDGKVDLNAAPLELLIGLLRQLGLDADAAEAMAERIIDFRDPDHDPQGQGVEDPQHGAAGRPTGARDRPFAAESELLGVLGMTPELYRRLRPFITVFSGAEGVDPIHAARPVLAAIPGMTDQLIEAYAKASPGEDPLANMGDSVVGIQPYLSPSREVMYMVRVEARTAGGGLFVREAVVELTGEPDRPFSVHVWRRGSLAGPGPEQARPAAE
jgi:general secretion pathway protein K